MPNAPPFRTSPAQVPAPRAGVADPRWTDLFTGDGTDLVVAGIPFDGAVLGRRGAAGGPTGIREAFRFLSTYDPENGVDLAGLRVRDVGDVPAEGGVLAVHEAVRRAVGGLFGKGAPVVILGGDNSLSEPNVEALKDALGGTIGLVVLDAHYDLRATPQSGIPTSGSPYRRLLESGTVAPERLVEIGIRPHANAANLHEYARSTGVHVVTRRELATRGAQRVAEDAVARAGRGADHLFVSLDIDGLDQSIASGCSAPGAGGMQFEEVAAIVRRVALDARCRGLEVVEVAPSLDPSGNTCRTAAQLVAAFAGGLRGRGAPSS
ncbi:MAG: agmatinase family protein [Thermoplasmatota archaeon]